MDNIDYFESIGGEEEVATCRSKVQLLHRQVCTRFDPYKEYFLTQPIARVLPARPDFTPTLSRSIRHHLQPQRQIKYLRGIIQQDYSQQATEELLIEDEHMPIRKLGNTTALLAETLFWAETSIIKSVKICEFISKEKLQPGREVWNAGIASPSMVIDLHEWIYELTVQGSQLYARTPRALFKLAQTGEIKAKIILQEELIKFHAKDEERLLLSTYQSRCSQLYEYEKEKLHLWCKLDGLVNSLWSRTDNQVVLCKDNAIVIADRRRKVVSDLMRRTHAHQNRIYSGITLGDTIFGERYYVTTQSFELCVYDIRKPYEPIIKMPHYCEEAPPSILQTWTSSNAKLPQELTIQGFQAFLSSSQQWRKENPLLMAHSPYLTGSSLFTELSINWDTPQQLIQMQFKGQANQFANRLQLLYDAGKMQQHYHPRAVTAFSIESHVGFIHLDNFYGLSLQILQRIPSNHDLKNYKQTPNNFVYKRVNFSMIETAEELQPPNQEWFSNHILQKQLESQGEDHWTNLLSKEGSEEEEDLCLQNQPFEEKVVRFADLKQFYHKVHEQAKDYPLQEKIKQEEASITKENMKIHSARNEPTQSQTQKGQDVKQRLKVGHLPAQVIDELLEEWSSL